MITKKVLVADRIRRIDGGFSFIPHRFLADGFLKTLSQQQLLLYIFLVLAADVMDSPFTAMIASAHFCT
jgi:hypothetical protein